jgi:branched-subunit amino acid ABC-type transport system permease component
MSSFQDFIQFAFSGLTSGAIYAMVALGFGVVHNTMGIVNFTQVDFVSLGGMLFYAALVSARMPIMAALPAAVIGVTLIGALVELTGLRPSRSRNHLVLILLTIGLSIGFVAFLVSEFVAVPIQLRAVKMIKEMQASGQHQPPAEFPKTLKRASNLAILTVVLLFLASMFMVAAGFY